MSSTASCIFLWAGTGFTKQDTIGPQRRSHICVDAKSSNTPNWYRWPVGVFGRCWGFQTGYRVEGSKKPFRHSLVTNLHRQGYSLTKIARLLGHSSASMTARYVE